MLTETRPDKWLTAKEILGNDRVTLGAVATHSWLHQPEHLAFQLARYRVAVALIGNAENVAEFGCGEGIGAGILAKGRRYTGFDLDGDAIVVASETRPERTFLRVDLLRHTFIPRAYDAIVSLDVIEHIDRTDEDAFFENVTGALTAYGVCVIGTPSLHMEHLASPQSRAGHVNLFSPERLRDTLAARFHVVQILFMQDTGLHLGHPRAAHYLVGVGIGPKREA